MGSTMRVETVRLSTADRDYSFDFDGKCTVLDGPVGTGKSSLLELIKHVFGGTAVLTPVIRDNVKRVHADIRCGEERLNVSRGFGKDATTIEVFYPDTGRQIPVPIRPRAGVLTFSDTILDALDIPSVRIPRSRSRSGASNVPITFGDVFSYQYIEQQEIDRSIVHHTETFREPKRRATFELLFGILDPAQLEAETELGEVKDRLKEARTDVETVSIFLETANIDEESTLARTEQLLTSREEAAASDLRRLRDEVESSTMAHAHLRARVAAAEASLLSASEDAVRAERLKTSREHLLAQLQLDAERGEKAQSASLRLGPLEFVSCPRCLQDIDESRAAAHECALCLQPVAPSEPSRLDLDSLDDLDEQAEELVGLLREARDSHTAARARQSAQEVQLIELRAALDRATAEAVAPRFQEIELLSAERAHAVAERESVRQNLRLWNELRVRRDLVTNLERRSVELSAVVQASKTRSASAQSRLDDLSDLFNETVQSLAIPWASSAHIDKTNYMPFINNEPFDTSAVAGGTKTVITVAYHLTLLSYSIYRPEVTLPSLLIMDTPRKNLGSNESDLALGARIYSRLRAILDGTNRSVQVIVADNDPPTGRDWFNSIHFDYDSPLLSDVGHPGEAAARSGALDTVEAMGVRRGPSKT